MPRPPNPVHHAQRDDVRMPGVAGGCVAERVARHPVAEHRRERVPRLAGGDRIRQAVEVVEVVAPQLGGVRRAPVDAAAAGRFVEEREAPSVTIGGLGGQSRPIGLRHQRRRAADDRLQLPGIVAPHQRRGVGPARVARGRCRRRSPAPPRPQSKVGAGHRLRWPKVSEGVPVTTRLRQEGHGGHEREGRRSAP